MSMVCFELSNALHEKERELRSIEITDGASLCAYLKSAWELIYNHKMFGFTYDLYADGIQLQRENGFVVREIDGVEHMVMRLCSAFPDLKIHIAAIFASPEREGAYRVWMRYYFTGTNRAYSLYGPPTGLKLEGDKAVNLSDFHVKKIDGEWLIVLERTMRPCDYLRAVCTGDKSFSSLEM